MGTPTEAGRSETVRALLLVILGSTCIQFSSGISMTLFGALGAPAVSSLRFALAAAVLLLIFRPKVTGRGRREWAGILIYGLSMAAMNLTLYLAIARIPIGVAVTLEFLGPCAVALFASRRIREGLCAVLALVGVALIAGPGGVFDLVGYLWALAAAAAFALYTVFSARVGKTNDGVSGLALSVLVAAVASAPFGLPALPGVTPAQWGWLLLSAVIGLALPYTVDMFAARLTSARVMGTLFSVDPMVAALIGLLVFGQRMPLLALGGVLVVAVAGAGIVWLAGRRQSS